MTCTECERPVKARGWCSRHYGRMYRTGRLDVTRWWEGHTSDQILALLEADGGWLATECVIMCLPEFSRAAIRASLYRLRDRGVIRSRRVHPESGPFGMCEWANVA